jgi:LysR family transcriptional regulator, glycine cleavage system transcriptional activator
MGPLRLIREDVAARRLVIPLSGPVLPARSYFLYVAKHRSEDRAIRSFCDWLIEAGRDDGGLEVGSDGG